LLSVLLRFFLGCFFLCSSSLALHSLVICSAYSVGPAHLWAPHTGIQPTSDWK
jgi:hypothetical protein